MVLGLDVSVPFFLLGLVLGLHAYLIYEQSSKFQTVTPPFLEGRSTVTVSKLREAESIY